ncbi:hypothetical protein BDN71DRAFT_1456287, partial [Pleurotus eryngii]
MNNEQTTDTDGWPREELPDEQCRETKRGKGSSYTGGSDARSVRDRVGAVETRTQLRATRWKPANYNVV